jgi:hypothetical protein
MISAARIFAQKYLEVPGLPDTPCLLGRQAALYFRPVNHSLISLLDVMPEQAGLCRIPRSGRFRLTFTGTFGLSLSSRLFQLLLLRPVCGMFRLHLGRYISR